jgi:hypothetical protein
MAATVRVGLCTNWRMAYSWLTLKGYRRVVSCPAGRHAPISQRGRASVIHLALALLDHYGTCHPLACQDLS